MSPRLRIAVVVALAAVAAVSVAVGAAVLQSSTTSAPKLVSDPCPAGPPLLLDLGLRAGNETRVLRRGAAIYERRARNPAARRQAERIFAVGSSLDARVAASVASGEPLLSLGRLARSHPRSALVQLHLGLARLCAGQRAGAVIAWRAAARAEPDTPSAVRAGDLLHPHYFRGLPPFTPTFRPPRSLRRLSGARAVLALTRAARGGDVRSEILLGVVFQGLERPRSALNAFARAAARAPNDLDAQVALAVGRFDKDRPARAFSRLGPLARRFPRAATVRYHLGLLLLWLGQADAGKRQLRLAVSLNPRSPLGREAGALLARLVGK